MEWFNNLRSLWTELKSQNIESEFEDDKHFDKRCGKCIAYLHTVQPTNPTEKRLLEDMLDVLFESEESKQVSAYMKYQSEEHRTDMYLRITSQTISDIIKLKRRQYKKNKTDSDSE